VLFPSPVSAPSEARTGEVPPKGVEGKATQTMFENSRGFDSFAEISIRAVDFNPMNVMQICKVPTIQPSLH
jgi:hypothetical protein